MTEHDFALRIRQALDEGAEGVSYKASLRLERARQTAVARARDGSARVRPVAIGTTGLQLAGAGTGSLPVDGAGLWNWLRGAGLVAPLLVLVGGFIAIHEWHHRSFINELADLDLAVLLDEAPLDAYADSGFGAMLQRRAASVSPEAAEEAPAAHASASDAEPAVSAAEPTATAAESAADSAAAKGPQ
jgi:hypothetical protein